ncbi:MAG: glutathione S-transferase family protein [Pseudomonadota bacterium]
MKDVTIVLGNKNYSSWSLRGWLAVVQSGLSYDEIVIPLRGPDTKAEILRHSPSGKVPALIAGDQVIWDSLAIGEFLAERCPEAGLWPADPAARAQARAVTAEMHSGFAALRTNMPMIFNGHHPGLGRAEGVAEDIARIQEIWTDCRARFGSGGDFLFGAFCLADAAYAPVVSRFATYDVELEPTAAAYRDAVLAYPAMVAWRDAAAAEPWTIDFPQLAQAPAAPRPQ